MGNTVVVKPASHTPLSTLYLGELIKDILPKGVFNILSGPGKCNMAGNPWSNGRNLTMLEESSNAKEMYKLGVLVWS